MSSLIVLSLSAVSACLLASRRMLRIDTRASSASSFTRPTSCLRRSVDSGGTFNRITRPSEFGARPTSLDWIALEISLSAPASNGRIRICCGSGTLIVASCFNGVGDP